MTIFSKLRLLFVILLIISVTFAYSFWQTSNKLEAQRHVHNIIQNIIKTTSDFGFITNEYLTNRSARIQSQWHSSHASLESSFIKAKNILFSADDRISLKKITQNEAQAEKFLLGLISSKNNTNKISTSQKRKRAQTISQIRVRIQGILSESDRMNRRSLNRLIDAEKQLELTSKLLILVYAVLFIVSLLFVHFKIMKPIFHLQNNATQLAQGDYDARIPVKGKDEISNLASSYNTLAFEIKNKINSLTSKSEKLTKSQKELLIFNDNLKQMVDDQTNDLRNSENRQHAILESITDGVITLDNNYIIKNINPAVTSIFNYELTNLINRNITFLISDLKGIKKNTSLLYEKEGHHKNGTFFPIEVTLNRILVNDTIIYTCIVRDITEQKKSQRMQVEFVSNVSHELRTPLTSIRGALGLVNSGILDALPEKRTELLVTAYSNTERLMNLINDLLDIQKVQAGKLDFNITKINLTNAMQKALVDNEAYAKHHNVALKIGEYVDDLFINVDPLRLDQVMSNLISNAAKFSHDGDTIVINTRVSGTFAKITVEDSGEGIPIEFYSTIFNKFTQNDASATRKKGGTGLGLAITHQIVTAMNGSIIFTSAVGEGTTFIVYLPLTDNSALS